MFVVTPERPVQPPKVLPTQLRKEQTTQRRVTQHAATFKEAEPAVPTTNSREDTSGGSELSNVLIMFANIDRLSLVSCKLPDVLGPTVSAEQQLSPATKACSSYLVHTTQPHQLAEFTLRVAVD
jgi:hypothetical protein